MESELANLDSQIQMQQESVEAKDTEMRKIRDQINQVTLFEHCLQPVVCHFLYHKVAILFIFESEPLAK